MAVFDTAILLTNFVGFNENPLYDDGNWDQTEPTRAPLQRLSNSATNSASGNPNYSHWTHPAQEVAGLVEMYACTTGGQLGADLETWRIALWTITGSNVTGYLAYFGGSLSKDTVLRRYDGGLGSFTQIASQSFVAWPERMGLRITPTDVEVYEDYGGGWVFSCGAADTTYRGVDWYGGLGVETSVVNTNTFICFALSITPRRTQIYRILKGWE